MRPENGRNWNPEMRENQYAPFRQSPLQSIIAETDFGSPAVQSERANGLGLADRSLLEKWGVRGAGAADWLSGLGVHVPTEVYATSTLDRGGLIARIGKDEFFLEAGSRDQSLASFRDACSSEAGCTAVLHEDASLLVTGRQSRQLFAQTCSHRFEISPAEKWVYTRIAGVNCGVLPQSQGEATHYALWLDPSYAVYLWETLLEIVTELGGGASEIAE